jgi:glycosyltransferase involved in cell wall biosynthesis
MKDAMKRLGVSPEKISLIHFGIDTKKFSPRQKNKSLKARLGIDDSPTVVSLRNLNPLYDVESLVKSAPLVLKEIPETQFIIAGEGSEEEKLRRLAKSLGVADSVKFIGFVQNDELPEYLNTIDVYVSTSLSDAGIAASTAEAMACGLPVIVTDVADNRKWVEDGVNGFVIQTKDPKSLAEKIIYLLKNEDIRKRFGKVSRKIIEEKNDYYKEMGKMEGIYEQLVQRRKK